MDIFLTSFLNWDVFVQTLPMILKGLWITVALALLVIPAGLLAGFVIALLYAGAPKWLRVVLILFIDLFRSIPPLVLLVFVFYGLPFVGVHLPAILAVTLAMTLNTSSYYGEIFRNGFAHIAKGQLEAARSTGMSQRQALIWIATPQVVRNVFADLVGNSIEVVKATSIASVVALPELLRMARVAQGITYNATPLVAAAAVYLILLLPVMAWMKRFERKEMGGR